MSDRISKTHRADVVVDGGYTVRLWADESDAGNIYWVDFSVLDAPLGVNSDQIASGYVKWDGCTEVSISLHACGMSSYHEMLAAISRARREAVQLLTDRSEAIEYDSIAERP